MKNKRLLIICSVVLALTVSCLAANTASKAVSSNTGPPIMTNATAINQNSGGFLNLAISNAVTNTAVTMAPSGAPVTQMAVAMIPKNINSTTATDYDTGPATKANIREATSSARDKGGQPAASDIAAGVSASDDCDCPSCDCADAAEVTPFAEELQRLNSA